MSLEPPPVKTPFAGGRIETTPLAKWLYLLWQYITTNAGPAGPTGATGATGPTGPAGPPGSDATVPAHVAAITTTQIHWWDIAGTIASQTTTWARNFLKSNDAAEGREALGLSSTWRRLWAERDKASYTGDVQFSIIGATSDQRKLAANSITDGTMIRIRAVGSFYYPGDLWYTKLIIGPDGDFSAPYYFVINDDTTEFAVGTMAYEIDVEIYFRGVGGSATCWVCGSMKVSDGISESLVSIRRSVDSFTLDTTVDNWIDVTMDPGDPASSIYPAYSYAEICTP
jgi:hypothetical protein